MKIKLLIIVFLSLTFLLPVKGNCRSKILTIPSCAKDTIAVNQEGNFKNQQLKPIKTIQPTFNKPVRSALRPGIIYVCGVVIAEEDRKPLEALIQVKGTTIYKACDYKGKFQLIVPINFNILIVSLPGLKDQELKLIGSGFYKVVFKISDMDMSDAPAFR